MLTDPKPLFRAPRRICRRIVLAGAVLMMAACTIAPRPHTPHMVSAANPLAAAAGRDILRAGGSAVDAAVAMQMVLTLVEPQSSGIGGGAFLLHYDAKRQTVSTYDGRETAPRAATADMFLAADGAPRPFYDAVVGGLAVGVPGVLRMLESAHADAGQLPWASLFAPAIALAEGGFEVSPRLHRLITSAKHLKVFPETSAYFHNPDGTAKAVGTRLANPALAATLRTIARDGADAFYEGPIATDLVATVRTASLNPGRMTEADLAAYRSVKRPLLCRPYREWRVCGMGPPSSGGLTVLQILGIVESFDLAGVAPNSLEAVHLIAEASRLAFADRNIYMADSDFVPIPVDQLLDRAYLARRAALISPHRSLGTVSPGALAMGTTPRFAAQIQAEGLSTTHFSIIDGAGNAVSMTSSIENAFGARLMTGGFLLNNQLTDFSFRPEINGAPVANRVEPGKRPRSSMSPTLVFTPDGRLLLAIGSPGGSRIIGYVAQTLIAVLDWNMEMQAAIDLPHFVNRNGKTELEKGTSLEALVPGLNALGHKVSLTPLVSGLHGIAIRSGGLDGGADARREGVVLSD